MRGAIVNLQFYTGYPNRLKTEEEIKDWRKNALLEEVVIDIDYSISSIEIVEV